MSIMRVHLLDLSVESQRYVHPSCLAFDIPIRARAARERRKEEREASDNIPVGLDARARDGQFLLRLLTN